MLHNWGQNTSSSEIYLQTKCSKIFIGRSKIPHSEQPSSLVVLDFSSVSLRHAIINTSVDPPFICAIQDLGSMNGTFISTNRYLCFFVDYLGSSPNIHPCCISVLWGPAGR